MDVAKSLKVIGNYGVGIDKIDVKHATELGIQVTNGPYSNLVAVAEYTMALILALETDLIHMDSQTREGHWNDIRDTTNAREIKGRTLGIVGFGHIGRYVAQCAKTFGMHIIIYNHNLSKDTVPGYVTLIDSLAEIFSKADVVSLHVPLTKATFHLVSDGLLNCMKPSAYIINCARGGVIDENALYTKLVNKEIAGAGINCFEEEPVRSGNKLLKLSNIIVGPHSAGQTVDSVERMSLHAAIGIDEVLSGKNPSWPVNFVDKKIISKCMQTNSR
jgi:D-3-phosphoglycerate dehydrogenase